MNPRVAIGKDFPSLRTVMTVLSHTGTLRALEALSIVIYSVKLHKDIKELELMPLIEDGECMEAVTELASELLTDFEISDLVETLEYAAEGVATIASSLL